MDEDFSYYTVMHRKQLWGEIKSIHSEGRRTYLYYRSMLKMKLITSYQFAE